MPFSKKKPAKKPAQNPRLKLVDDIMEDMEILLPPIESGRKDGFEMIEHNDAIKRLWEIAHELPAFVVGAENVARRERWYTKFDNQVRVAAGFRKGGKKNVEAWDRVQTNLRTLKATH